jgi:hypothetical protein
MGLFDTLKGSSGSKNYAQLYKDAVAEGNVEKSIDVLKGWSDVPDKLDDSNFLLAMAGLNAITDEPRDTVEMYLKKYRIDSSPVDPSLASWYRQFASVALKRKGFDSLVDEYL